jgi:hypothetical protein
MIQRTPKKERDKNLRVRPAQITTRIIDHLGIATLQDGDMGCKIAKDEALEELPHAISAYAAEGYAIYSQHSVAELFGMHAELYQMLQRIALYGEAGIDTIETFRRAVSYVLDIYCKAYALVTEEEREALFRQALEILVATYPLYLPGGQEKYPHVNNQGRLPFPRLVIKKEDE